MTREEEEEIRKKFNLNLENAIFELTNAMEAEIHENKGSCILEALKDIKKAVEEYDDVYTEEFDFLSLDSKGEFRLPY